MRGGAAVNERRRSCCNLIGVLKVDRLVWSSYSLIDAVKDRLSRSWRHDGDRDRHRERRSGKLERFGRFRVWSVPGLVRQSRQVAVKRSVLSMMLYPLRTAVVADIESAAEKSVALSN
jgi:hypothetical protein